MLHRKASLIVLILALLFFFIYTFSYPRFSESYTVFLSPGKSVDYFFSNLYRETGELRYSVPYHGELPDEVTIGFMPRDATQKDGNIVPKHFLGGIITSGVFSACQKHLPLLLMPLFGVLVALSLYLIAREIFDAKTAILSFALALAFPVLWLASSRLQGNDLPSLFFLLMAIYYVIKLWKENAVKNHKYIPLISLFLALSLFFRLDQIIAIVPVIALLLWLWYRKQLKNSPMILSICIGMAVLVPILLLNNDLYGGWFATGYSVAQDSIKNTINFMPTSLFNFSRVPAYLTNYALHFPLLLVGVVLGIITILARKSVRAGNVRYYFIAYFCYLFIVLLLYYGKGVSWGLKEEFFINASFLRHFLPVFLFMVLFLSALLRNLGRHLVVLILVVLMVSSAVTIINANEGINDQFKKADKFVEFRNFVLGVTEENAVIITQYRSTVLFPQRDVISTEYWVQNPVPVERGNKRPVQFVPSQAVFTEKILALLRSDLPVYMTTDEAYLSKINLKELEKKLRQEGYEVSKITGKGESLYKLCKDKQE